MASIATYKAPVDQIIAIETEEDVNKACAAVDRAYQHGEKITYKDNEQLYRLIGKVCKDF